MRLKTTSLYNGFCLQVDPWKVKAVLPVAILGMQVNPPLWCKLFKVDYGKSQLPSQVEESLLLL